jgi:hypothetical protein
MCVDGNVVADREADAREAGMCVMKYCVAVASAVVLGVFL